MKPYLALSVGLFFYSLGSLRASPIIVEKPFTYSTQEARYHAKYSSDTPEYKSYGCSEIKGSEGQEVYECSGFITKLMHGGHPIKHEFICEFRFKQRLDKKYELLEGYCD